MTDHKRTKQAQRRGSGSRDLVDASDTASLASPATSPAHQTSGIEPHYVRIDGIARYTSISIRQLHDLTRAREIPHIRIHKVIVYDLVEITEWMTAHSVATTEMAEQPGSAAEESRVATARLVPPLRAEPTKAQQRSKTRAVSDFPAQSGLVAQSRRVVHKDATKEARGERRPRDIE